MSQHLFKTLSNGCPVIVLLGWDRPLGNFFMTVERVVDLQGAGSAKPSGDNDEDEFLYSNLDEPNAFGLSLDHFKRVLARLQITVPAAMFDQVELDKAQRVGNRFITWQADGSFHDRHGQRAAIG